MSQKAQPESAIPAPQRPVPGELLRWLWPTLRDLRGLYRIHWLVVSVTLLSSFGAADAVRDRNDEINKLRFDRETELVIEQFRQQLKRYEDALWAGVSAIHMHKGAITREQWSTFTRSMRLAERYPAISRLGLLRSVPHTDLAEYVEEQRLSDPDYFVFPPSNVKLHFPMQYMEPLDHSAGPVGRDAAAESHRRHAILRARDSGKVQISEPISLEFIEGNSPADPAVAVFVPFYTTPGVPPESDRPASFEGAVVAPVVIRHMLGGRNERARPFVSFTVADGRYRLFDDRREGWSGHDDQPLYTSSRTVRMWGRPWTFEFSSTLKFRQDAADHQPLLILLTGLSMSAMLFALFIVMTRANRKTTHYASRLAQLSSALRNKADALEDSNAELERFACVVAHDLKAPLGRIDLLCDRVEEDLSEMPESGEFRTEAISSLQRARLQIVRMRELIDGVMRYSSDGGQVQAVDSVDTRQLITDIGESLELAPGELTIVGRLPELQTSRIQLQQVLENLIGNAFKYHPQRDEARVRVWCDHLGDFLRFSVRDNGAGIDVKYHDLVFQMFQTVPSRNQKDSTGVGLAIVKRTVESMGGVVSIDSAPGKGTTFRFTWPVDRYERGAAAPPARHAGGPDDADDTGRLRPAA